MREMKIAGLIDDLFFTSKLREICQQMGASLTLCRSAAEVPTEVSRVIVDLSATTFDSIAEIAKIKEDRSLPVTAFFSHVQIDAKERAQKAGADEVVPRSAFAQRLTEILKS
jgi:DNA-binding NarL/FixJ family response regulator